MLKRIFTVVAAAALLCCLCSCGGTVSELVAAPKYSGEMYDIQQALYNYAGRTVSLRFPQSGDNRTAFVRCDLDGDSVEEALAFYSINSADGVAQAHLNVIDKVGSKWVSVCDAAVGSDDIHKVDVAPLSPGSAPIITVGARMFSSTGNQLTLLTYSGGRLKTLMQTAYTDFKLCDLEGKGFSQLLVLDHKPAEHSAAAYVYTSDSKKVDLLGSAPLDGNIGAFSALTFGSLSDGRPAVFIDSTKSSSAMITDLVCFDGGKPVNPFFDSDSGETQSTYRSWPILCSDINGDGVTDIPFSEVLPGYDLKPAEQQKYLTIWRSFDGAHYKDTLVGDFNYEGEYRFAFPSGWQGNVTLIYDDQNRMRSYRVWDRTLGSASDEILRIRVYSTEEYSNIDSSELIELARNDSSVWAARIVMTSGEYGLTADRARECFSLM